MTRDTLIAESLARHPVGRLFPDGAQARIVEQATLERAATGCEVARNREVTLVVDGVLAARDEQGPCLSLHGRGSVLGLELIFAHEHMQPRLEVIVNATWLAVPLHVFRTGERPFWAERMFAHDALDQRRWLMQELSCALLHHSRSRVAAWLLRIHHFAGRPDRLPVTQGRLADLLTYQRTTINGLMTDVEARGLLKTGRGYVTGIDRARLSAESCGCAA
jgi:CRP-like cAMP-binding protein